MKHLKIYGASDDLIEIEGDLVGCDEYDSDKQSFSVAGLYIGVSYEQNGVWAIHVKQVDESVPVTAENISLSVHPRSDGEPGYSMCLDMDVPDGCHVDPVTAVAA